MKQVLFCFLAAGLFFSCKDEKKTGEETAKVAGTADSVTQMDYAYTIEHPDQWVPGNRENTRMVLQSLKDYENGNIEACMKSFADSVELSFDGFHGKFTRDSVQKMFTADRSRNKSMKIDMHDFESVKSKDGKKEYVSLWYNEKWEDQKGKMDSVSVMDDLEIKNGKIISIDQKIRHFPKAN